MVSRAYVQGCIVFIDYDNSLTQTRELWAYMHTWRDRYIQTANYSESYLRQYTSQRAGRRCLRADAHLYLRYIHTIFFIYLRVPGTLVEA